MKERYRWTRAGPWLLALAALAQPAAALSVRSSFAERTLSGLEPGKSYSLREIGGEPAGLSNAGGERVAVELEAAKPEASALRDGYEPIPDARWVSVERSSLSLEPGGEGSSDVLVSLPDDPSLWGKQLQVQLKIRASAPGMSTELESRLLLRMARRAPAKDKGSPAASGLECRPAMRELHSVALGRRVAVFPPLKLINAQDRPAKARLEAAGEGQDLPEGFIAAPDPNFLRLPTEELETRPESVRELPLELEIPDQARYRSRRWAFRVGVEGTEAKASCLLLVTTEDAPREEKKR